MEENLFEFWLHFQLVFDWLPKAEKLYKLLHRMSNLSREDTLHDICAIETIHAVGSHDTILGVQNSACLSIDQLSLSKSNVHLSHKVTIAEHLLFDNRNKLR